MHTAQDQLDQQRWKAEKEQLGQLLRHMIRTLAVRERASIKQAHQSLGAELDVKADSIYKWRRGISLPSHDALERLIEIGVARAGMDRIWTERMLALAKHPEPGAVVHRLFPSEAPASNSVRHNLPRQPSRALIGRAGEIEELRRRLAPPSREHVVAIEGMRGTGKTALALEVAWGFLAAYEQFAPGSRFDTIVWVSAKRELLDSRGVLLRPPLAISSLDDLLRAIEAVVTGDDDIPERSHADRVRAVERLLRGRERVLLIVDSLDDLAADELGGEALAETLAFLRDLPPPHRALVTAHFHEDLPQPLHLDGLEFEAMLEYVRQEAKARGVSLNAEQFSALAQAAGGVPEVAWWYLGLMAREGLAVEEVADPRAADNEPLTSYLLGDAFAVMRKRLPADFESVLRILYTLTFFDERAGGAAEAICRAAHVRPELCRRALHLLGVLNLVNRREDHTGSEESGPRFTTVPYAGMYARSLLDAAERDAARARWVAYYLRLAEEHGRVSPTCSADYDLVECEWPNLRNVFAWLAQRPDAYERLTRFWGDDCVSTFADVRGYWEDRRRWLGWLAEAAAARADWGRAAAAVVGCAQATILLERYDEADMELNRARGWSAHAPPEVRCELYNRRTMLAVRRRDFAAARQWLDELEQALTHDALDAAERRRQEIDAAYYRGRILFLEGATEEAAPAFQRMLQLCDAQKIHWARDWVRERAYAQYALAEVAVKEGQLAGATPLLEAAFDVATKLNDRRLRGSVIRTRAALWRRLGHAQQARQATSDAQHEFDQLGMKQEAAETPECVAALAGRKRRP